MRKVLTIMLAALLVSGCAQAATPDPTASEQPSPSASAAADAPSAVPSPAAEPSPSPSPSPSTLWDVASAASLQVIVNKLRPMDPAAFAPELVPVSTENEEGAEVVRPELDAALTRMDAAMRAAIGEGTFVTSSYRSYELQAQYYQNAISSYGQQAADTTSARPGYSEHQTGLAIDLQSTARECRLDHCFGATDAGIWIAEHAWEFGFVVRYPQGADAVTGYAWEPWHLRFVGTEVTTAMHEQGIGTLEEFFGLEPAPGYAS